MSNDPPGAPDEDRSAVDFQKTLLDLDGRPYGDYRRIAKRHWRLHGATLVLEYVQGDPFAAPSRLRLDVPAAVPCLGQEFLASDVARRAAADFLHRALLARLAAGGDDDRTSADRGVRTVKKEEWGGDSFDREPSRSSGGRSQIGMADVGQEVLARTGLVVRLDGSLRLRLTAGLPAAGRRILGRRAVDLLLVRLPALLSAVFEAAAIDRKAMLNHLRAVEDQVALRAQLESHGLVAFLAEGAILPRASGVDASPLVGALPLDVPDALAVELEAPHAGRLRGLGIRRGITLIVGGGYHGKSTLLDALARSVYDHVPGDGRERCVTLADAISVRAEDGRSVRGVDLRPFIGALPLRRSSERFDSADASGSTSQAAAIVEGLEAGATTLLIDEDTAATNFMIRDARMRELVPADREPITPFIDRVRQLAAERSISSVLVVGGAGDYFDVADFVIRMETYQPGEATAEARAVAARHPLAKGACPGPPGPWPEARDRIPDPASFDPRHGQRRERVRSRRIDTIEFGAQEIDLSGLAQLVEAGQARTLGDLLLLLGRELADGQRSMSNLLDEACRRLAADLEAVTEAGFGDRTAVRRHEFAAAINRLRSLRLR